MIDPDDEPLEFCANSGFQHLSPAELEGSVEILMQLPENLCRNGMQLAFRLWMAGRSFEDRIEAIAVRHKLTPPPTGGK